MTDINKNAICDKYENLDYLARIFLPIILIFVSFAITLVIAFYPPINPDELIKYNIFARELGLAFLGTAKRP